MLGFLANPTQAPSEHTGAGACPARSSPVRDDETSNS